MESQDVLANNCTASKPSAIHPAKIRSLSEIVKEPPLIQSCDISCGLAKTNNKTSARRISKSTRNIKAKNDSSQSSANDGCLMKAPKLENLNELPKLLRRPLRSLSPPKLVPEATISKLANKQNTLDNDSKVHPREDNNVVKEIKPASDLIDTKNRHKHAYIGNRQTFREEWLQDPVLSPWIQKYPPDPTKAFCPICKLILGAKHSSLITHSNSGGHDKCFRINVLREPSEQSLRSYLDEMPVLSPYRQIFRDEWLSDPDLTPWLQKHN
mgnify:CR=1 FL=1